MKINYNKTVELNKLVLQDTKLPDIRAWFILFVFISSGGMFIFQIIKWQLQGDHIYTSDYLIIFFSTLFYILVSFLALKTILSRSKLKEIEITLHRDEAKQKILKAASGLNWSLFLTSKNYFRFRTKSTILFSSQTITIIFFPDNKVFFNSLNYPDDELRPSRFYQNYTSLIEELNKENTTN